MIQMKERLAFVALLLVTLAFLQPVSASISLTDFNIQKDEPDTNSPNVILYISAVDGNKMMLNCDNSSGVWTDYSTTYSFNLNTGPGCTSGDGVKTVYIKVQDENSNQATGSDTINLDTTAPDINSVWHDANSSDENSVLDSLDSLIIRVTGEKDCNAFASISGIGDLNLFDDGSHNDVDANDGVYGASFSVASFGKSSTCMTYVVGKLVDKVGNEGTKNSFTKLCIDLNKPSYSAQKPKNYTNKTKPDINVQLTDSESGVLASSIQMWVDSNRISDSNISKTAISNGYLVSYTPSSALSPSTVSVGIHFTDLAGNGKDANWQFTIDTNAPSAVSNLKVKGVSGDNDVNAYWSTTTDTGGSGLSHYILYRYTQSITESNLSSASIVSSNISSTSTSHVDAMSSSDEDKTYYYAIKAADAAGNLSGLSNVASIVVPDITPPSDINFFMPWYVNTVNPTIKVSGSDVYSASFSCNDSNYSSKVTGLSSVQSFSITKSNGCTDTDGNRTIYARVFDNHDNNSKVSRMVYLDRVKPNPATITSTKHENGNNFVYWSAATDTGSGVCCYRLYYKASDGVTLSDSYVLTTDLNYHHVLEGRGKYCYRIAAVDLAGNVSDLSAEQCQASDANAATISIALNGGVYRNGKRFFSNGNITIAVDASYSLKSASGWIEYSDGNKHDFNFTGSGTTFYASVSILPIEGKAKVHVDAIDSLDLNSSSERSFYIDVTPPEISSIEIKQKDKNTLEIKASVSDDTDRVKVMRSVEGKLVGISEIKAGDFNEGKIALEWRIAGMNLQDVNIVLIAFDDLNNKSESSAVKLLVQGVEEKIGKIGQVQKALSTNISLLNDFLIEPSQSVSNKFSLAKQHLEKARQAMAENNASLIESEIGAASKLLSEIEQERPQVSVANTQVVSYGQGKDLLAEKLSQHLNGSALLESKALWKKLVFKREVQSIEVKEKDKVKNYVFVVLYVTNASQEDLKAFNVVERVPKRISKDSTGLSFNTLHKVVKEDPVIAFYVPGLKKGEERAIKYRSKKAFTGKEIASLESNSVELFEMPIPIPAKFNPSQASFNGAQPLIPMPVLVVIIACILTYVVWRVRRELHG